MGFYVIADEDTVAGFRFAGVPGTAVRTPREAESELDRVVARAGQDIIIVTEQIANAIRERVSEVRFGADFPLIVEIPGPEGESADSPSLMKMIREAVGIRV